MNPDNCLLAQQLISKTYIQQGSSAISTREKLVKSLLSSKRLPSKGWDEATIENFIQECSMMDSNNFVDNVGVGEREGRVVCDMVARRHWRLAHGIGRSGDVAAEQPKAAGSSLLAKLTNLLVADALRLAGLEDMGACSVLPLATGMTVTTALLALRAKRGPTARYVVWSRIDQKTCLKAVVSAGLVPVVLPLSRVGDELHTDMTELQSTLDRLGPENVVCVLTTTSCFAPRASDSVIEIAKLCKKMEVGHIINNAYGVQARSLCSLVTAAWRRGQVDAVIQSTDKNFMVPVGGAVVCAGKTDPSLVHAINQMYPGRAAMAPLLDTLITLLSLGQTGWQRLLADREAVYTYMVEKLAVVASKHGERILDTPGNPISIGFTLSHLEAQALSVHCLAQQGADVEDPTAEVAARVGDMALSNNDVSATAPDQVPPDTPPVAYPDAPAGTPPVAPAGASNAALANKAANKMVTFLGSMLFSRAVSGVRVISRGVNSTVAGIHFTGFGSSHDEYPVAYMTAAAALGTSRDEVDTFCQRLDHCLSDLHRKISKSFTKGK